ncbi:MAG: cupredoxin domain-containing protein [Gammaproteobacteria bacterium]
MATKLKLQALLLLSAVIVIGAGGGIFMSAMADNVQPPQVQINIQNFKFSPAKVSVEPGTTVVWTNLDDVIHTVVSDTDGFRSSGQLSKSDSYSLKLNKPGDYPYHCGIHPFMQGVIRVISSVQDSQTEPANPKQQSYPHQVESISR